MKRTRSTLAGLIAAAALAVLSGTAPAQTVLTPYSPDEAGPALGAAEELAAFGPGASAECFTPISPNECGPAELQPTGATITLPRTGIVVPGATPGSAFPDHDSDANPVGD